MKYKWIISGVMLALLAGTKPVHAQTDSGARVHSLSIDDALAMAKKNNLQVKQALNAYRTQVQTNKALTAQALPNLSGTAGTQVYFQTPVFIIPAGSFGSTHDMAVSFTPKYSATAGATLTQTIFDGSVFVGLKARQSALDYAKKAVDLTQEQVMVNIYKVYYQLVVSRTQVKLIGANIERANKLLSDSRAMFQNGFAEKLDVDKANVQLANLETSLGNTQTTITNGYLGLKYLIGLPESDSVVLTTDFQESDLMTGISVDSAYHYEERFDYQSLQINQSLTQYDIKRYKAVYYPTVSLTGVFQKNALGNEYNFFTSSGQWFTTSYVGGNINIPIFSGFSKNANLQKARIAADQVNNQLDDLKRSIDNEVAQARNNFFNAMKTIDNQKVNSQLAESVYDQTKKKFESGLASNTDVTNAQTDLIQAQTNLVNALYNAVIARIDYLKAIGKI